MMYPFHGRNQPTDPYPPSPEHLAKLDAFIVKVKAKYGIAQADPPTIDLSPGNFYWRGSFNATLLNPPGNPRHLTVRFYYMRRRWALADGMSHILLYGIPVKYPHMDCAAPACSQSRRPA